MSTPSEIPRWLAIPIGLALMLLALLGAMGSVTLMISPPEKNPTFGFGLGALLLLGCLWILAKCVRLVMGWQSEHGVFSPLALRVIAWCALLLPIAGLFTGHYAKRGFGGIVQAVIFVWLFFHLHKLARERDGSLGVALEPDDPLFAAAVAKARASVGTLRELAAAHPHGIAVKYLFKTDSGNTEHIWGQLIELGATELKASILTPPLSHEGELPEQVAVPIEALEDWHLKLPDGSIRGNFTTQAEIAIRKSRGLKVPRQIRALEGRFVDS